MGRTAESSQFRHRLVAQLAMTLVVATGCASTSEATSPTFSEQTTTTTAIDTSTTRASPRVIGPVEHSGGGSGSVRLAESEEHVFDVFQPPLRIAAQDSEWRVFEHNQQSLVVQGGEVSVMFYGLAERDSAETFDYLVDEGKTTSTGWPTGVQLLPSGRGLTADRAQSTEQHQSGVRSRSTSQGWKSHGSVKPSSSVSPVPAMWQLTTGSAFTPFPMAT